MELSELGLYILFSLKKSSQYLVPEETIEIEFELEIWLKKSSSSKVMFEWRNLEKKITIIRINFNKITI